MHALNSNFRSWKEYYGVAVGPLIGCSPKTRKSVRILAHSLLKA